MLHLICIFVFNLLENVHFISTHMAQSTKEQNILSDVSQELEPRILHGRPANPGEYPWVVFMSFLLKDRPGQYTCGGSIITRKHVLTAGHCCTLTRTILDSIRVRVRMNPDCESELHNNKLLGSGCDSYIREYKIEKVTDHTPYTSGTFPNGDICIMKTTEDIEFNKYVQPIKLPFGNGVDFRSMSFVGIELTTVGWGFLDEAEGPRKSFLLMETTLKGVDFDECKDKWMANFPRTGKKLGLDLICAGSSSESVPCRGDSGGPLMYVHEGQTYIIGVVSGGTRCIPFNPVDVPAFFVRVDWYKTWIQTEISKDLENQGLSLG